MEVYGVTDVVEIFWSLTVLQLMNKTDLLLSFHVKLCVHYENTPDAINRDFFQM